MASETSTGQAISEVARAEGGTEKGSVSAQMQSEVAKQQNAEEGTAAQGNKSPAGQAISEVAQAEGGTTKGSVSAQMQSEVTKQQNAQQGTAAQANKSPAGQLISEVAQAEGGTTKGSVSAQMQSEVTKQQNAEQGTGAQSQSSKSPAGQAISEVAQAEGGTTKGSISAQMQSEVTKQQNAEQGTAAQSTDSQSAKSPVGQVISEVAQAEGGTTKGSVSAQMQSEFTKQQNAEQGTAAQGSSSASTNAATQTDGLSSTGATSDEARSQAAKQENFENVAQEVMTKMQQDPTSVTKDDASLLESRESRVMGGARPPTDSISADAKRLASANENGDNIPAPSPANVAAFTANGGADGSAAAGTVEVPDYSSEIAKIKVPVQDGPASIASGSANGRVNRTLMDRSSESQQRREANFQAAIDEIEPKMRENPESVTKEDANLLRSRENRAHGGSEKGGIAAQAQRIVAENEKKKKTQQEQEQNGGA